MFMAFVLSMRLLSYHRVCCVCVCGGFVGLFGRQLDKERVHQAFSRKRKNRSVHKYTDFL